MKKWLFILIFFLWSLPFVVYGLDVPGLQGYVNDYAEMISPPAKSRIDEELRAFERSDSTQIVILTIPSLEGGNIEEFGIKVAETWKIGQQGKDNGILFIVSKQERKIRVEVGRGLEGKLTDLMAGRIIDLVITPRFKRADFDGGFMAGVSALIDATRGEFKAEQRPAQRRQKGLPPFLTIFLFLGVFTLILGSISRILGGITGALGSLCLSILLSSLLGSSPSFYWPCSVLAQVSSRPVSFLEEVLEEMVTEVVAVGSSLDQGWAVAP